MRRDRKNSLLGRRGVICTLFSLCLCLLAPTSGCVSHHSERMVDVNPKSWEPDDSVQIRYENSADTTTRRNISILMRVNSKFSDDQLEIDITTKTPRGESLEESHTLNTAHPTSILTNYKEYSILYRTDVILSQIGSYTFTITPRSRSVVGVTGIGVKIESN